MQEEAEEVAYNGVQGLIGHATITAVTRPLFEEWHLIPSDKSPRWKRLFREVPVLSSRVLTTVRIARRTWWRCAQLGAIGVGLGSRHLLLRRRSTSGSCVLPSHAPATAG